MVPQGRAEAMEGSGSEDPAGTEEAALAPRPSRSVAREARERRQAAARDARRLRRRYRLGLAGAWLVITFVVTSVVLALRSPFLAAEAFFITSVISVISMPLIARAAVPGWLLERSLRAGDRDAALRTQHLSPPLAELVRSTRILRLAIECADPWDSSADRNVGAWITALRRLPPGDRALLGELGLSERGVESILLADADRDEPLDRRGLAELRRRRMEVLAEQLEGFESALLGHDPGPYR